MALTAKAIKALKPGPRSYRTYDGDGSHFGVQVSPKGTKSFFQAYTSPVTRRKSAGPISPGWPLE